MADTSNDTLLDYSYYFTYSVSNLGDSTLGDQEQSLSGYALPISPFIFIPTVGTVDVNDGYSNKRIVWDFGDGTRQEAITGVHAYTEPGTYKIKSYLYDKDGNGYYNTFSKTVDVYDFVEDKILLKLDTPVSHDTGEVKNPISVTQFNSIRTVNKNNGPAPIVLHADAKDVDVNYDLFETGNINKTYGHLLPSHTFIQRLSGSDNIIENIPVDKLIATNYTSLYATVSAGANRSIIIPASESDEGSVFVGVSSTNDVYFRSDVPSNYDLTLGFEEGSIFDFTNTTTYGVKANIRQNPDYSSLTVTSNGLDGEDNVSFNKFDINPVKFSCSKISFVVRVKDSEGFSHRYIPLVELCPLPNTGHLPLTASLVNDDQEFEAEFYNDFSSVADDLEPGDFLIPGENNGFHGGFFKGYFTIDTDEILEDVRIRVSTVYGGQELEGESEKFTIYPEEYYTVAKKGEDVDFTAVFKDVAMQPLFNDSKLLMNDFFGSIFGSIESAQDSLGKSTYEKIENFLDNNSIIDYTNIDQLASILKMLDLSSINKYSLPPKIKRLMDILSISQSRLFGDVNQNREDFNSFGYIDTGTYGKDRCRPIPENGAVFTYAGFDIVAFEKYSGKWTTLNTMLPLCASVPPKVTNLVLDPSPIQNEDYFTCLVGDLVCTPIITETLTAINVENDYFHICIENSFNEADKLLLETEYYSLSDYNESWGWPLTLDKDESLFDLYEFYYKNRYEKVDVENSVINFNDENTTIERKYTHNEWIRPDGVVSNIFSNALYDGLGLIDCAQSIPLSAIVTKEVVTVGDIDTSTYTVGSVITYRVSAENPNDIDLANVGIVETLRGAPTSLINRGGIKAVFNDKGYIPAGESIWIEYSYQTSEEDIVDLDMVSDDSIYTISNTAAFTSNDLKCPAISNTVDVSVFIPLKDLIVTKNVVSSGPYRVGEPVTYEIVIDNQNYVNIVAKITDSLPGAPDSLVNRSGYVSLFADEGTTIPRRESVSVRYDYYPTLQDIGELTNTASVSSSRLTTTTSNPVVINVPTLDNFVVSKEVITGTGPYEISETITYQITATNINSIAVTGATLVDSLPNAPTTLINRTGDVDIFTGTTIQPMSSVVAGYDYVVALSDIENLTNVATITSNEAADSPSNSVEVEINGLSALRVNKTLNTAPPYRVGQALNYTVTVENLNALDITNVRLEDSIAPITPAGGNASLLGTPGINLVGRTTESVDYEYIITLDDVTAASIVNTVSAFSDILPTTVDAISEITIPIEGLQNILISKTIDSQKDIYFIGDVIKYNVDVVNPNNVTLPNVQLQDTLSPIRNEAGDITLFTGTTLAPLESKSVEYEYVVANNGNIVNTASITSDLTPSVSSSTTAYVTTPKDLRITKSVVTGAGPYEVGDSVTYLITVHNDNDVDLTGVKVDDDFSSITVIGGDAGLMGSGISIPAGESRNVRYTYNVPECAGVTTITNTATVTNAGPAALILPPVSVTATIIVDENRWDFVCDLFDSKTRNWETEDETRWGTDPNKFSGRDINWSG